MQLSSILSARVDMRRLAAGSEAALIVKQAATHVPRAFVPPPMHRAPPVKAVPATAPPPGRDSQVPAAGAAAA
eukprot:306874-Pyramimonas_sp.AAC.1